MHSQPLEGRSNLSQSVTWKEQVRRLGLFVLFLICGLLVFAFGVDYHSRFPTNTSGAYKIGLSAIFLVAMVVLRRGKRLKVYWRAAFALFAASLTNVFTWYFVVGLREWLLSLLRLSLETPQGLAVAKLCDALLRVLPILVLVRLSGDDMGSIYLKKGNLRWSLTVGLLALVNLAATSIVIAASREGGLESVAHSIPWWFAYSLINGFMEEVWYRGLFLRRLQPVIGVTGSIWLTSLVFGLSHLLAVYIAPPGAPVFATIVFTLGLAFGLLMQKTDSIWGAVVFHLGTDLFWFVAVGF